MPPNPALDQIVQEYRTVYESCAPVDALPDAAQGTFDVYAAGGGPFRHSDLIRAMTVSRTAPELQDRMRRLREAGYDEVVVQMTPGSEAMIEDWARLFESV